MALNIPANEVSIRGVKGGSSSIGPITKDPMSFVYTPQVQQKRVETFDVNGYKTPGLPIPIAKDYRLQVGYNVFNPTVASLLVSTDVCDNEYVSTCTFILSDNSEYVFDAPRVIIDGQSINLDPLSDNMQLAFILPEPATFAAA